MAGSHVQFRADAELLQRIDEVAGEMGFSRSQAIRYFLSRAVGDKAEVAAAKQVVWGMYGKIRANMDTFNRQVYDLVLKYIGGTFQEPEPADADEPEPATTFHGRRARRKGP